MIYWRNLANLRIKVLLELADDEFPPAAEAPELQSIALHSDVLVELVLAPSSAAAAEPMR